MEKEEYDFELPVADETVAKAPPRIHVAPGDSKCVSCEG